MGVSWSSSSQRRWLTPAARWVTGSRQPVTSDRSVLLASQRPRGPVQMSEWRGVLDALRQLPTIAGGRTYREGVPVPVRAADGSPALTPGRDAVLAAPVEDAPSHASRPMPFGSMSRLAGAGMDPMLSKEGGCHE